MLAIVNTKSSADFHIQLKSVKIMRVENVKIISVQKDTQSLANGLVEPQGVEEMKIVSSLTILLPVVMQQKGSLNTINVLDASTIGMKGGLLSIIKSKAWSFTSV